MFSRGGTLPPSGYADARCIDAAILSQAGLEIPSGLAGSSLLPLANGAGDPSRKDYITAQYHSVFSVTGEFMIRQGDLKLIMYGANQFDWVGEERARFCPWQPPERGCGCGCGYGSSREDTGKESGWGRITSTPSESSRGGSPCWLWV